MIKTICPVCKKPLIKKERSFLCENGHCFDISKEGYVNLLHGKNKSGSLIGDNRDMALSRRDFLSKGYFSALSEGLIGMIKEYTEGTPVLCDICCGEGWYGEQVRNSINCELISFDISKEMLRLCAKRKSSDLCFVANGSSIPLESESVDLAFHLFAPFQEKEFSRIIKKGGTILTAVAGENHLFELKELLYDTPYKNDEAPPVTESLTLKEKRKFTKKVTLTSKDDIQALFRMTPYYYHTSDKDKAKIESLESLEVTTDFVVYGYKKMQNAE
ncbi:MAG: methyltransferase domain-containing protein, partial [Clostridia bacterium]|nr:methyltransferase domain-containing protein [Clostridia bacterium]